MKSIQRGSFRTPIIQQITTSRNINGRNWLEAVREEKGCDLGSGC